MLSKFFLVTILVGVIFVAGFANPNDALAASRINSLVGYWAFDEGEGETAKDYSGSENDAVLKGGPEWVDGKFGNALAFDGIDDSVEAPNMAGIAAFDEGTIELWVKLTVWDDYDNLFGTQTAANNVNVIRLERTWPDSDEVTAYIGDKTGAYKSSNQVWFLKLRPGRMWL